MKAHILTVKECAWTSEECHVEEDSTNTASQVESLCLPNLFRSKRVRPFSRTRTGPTYKEDYTAQELLLNLLSREAVQELTKRAGGATTAGATCLSHGREQATVLSEEQYTEALTWFSIVLRCGLFSWEDCGSRRDLAPKLDRWQGLLKRSSFQSSLLSLSRLQDDDKIEALSAFCSHLARCCQTLYTPGQRLAVKKCSLSYQHTPCTLHLALLCDISSGYICNVYPYCPGHLQRHSRTPVVEQVVCQLLRPYYSRGHVVQLDNSAWMEGRLTDVFSNLGFNVHFIPSVERPSSQEASLFPQRPVSHQHHWVLGIPETQSLQLVAHLQGWMGPAPVLQSELRQPMVDVFQPGLWATLHIACINTFVLHSLQCLGSDGPGKQISLNDFTRSLASLLATDYCVSVPVMPYQETYATHISDERISSSCGPRLKRSRQPGVCGLVNFGNSCYLNAVLQCLCCTVPLVEYLLIESTRKELATYGYRMAEALAHLLEDMWRGSRSICAPVEVRSTVASLHQQFNNCSQQDAQELLLFLFNAIHNDLKKMGERDQMNSSTGEIQNRSPSSAVCGSRSTIISHLFEGQLSYVMLCMRCGHQANSKQVFNMLSLPIPTGITKCSLQDCLSLFFQQSTLTRADQKLCSECGVKRDTSVLASLDKPPEILILHLKRSAFRGKKKVKVRNVLFSVETLDLSPFLSRPSKQRTTYSLYAVVNHTGQLDMGHYTALCHNPLTHSWHCFDDSKVTEVQDNPVQSQNAYMCFYSRKPFKKPKICGL